MKRIWPIPHTLYHFAYVITFILMLIVIVYSLIYNDPTSGTFNIMVILVSIVTLIGSIKTGITLKKKIIKNSSSSTT